MRVIRLFNSNHLAYKLIAINSCDGAHDDALHGDVLHDDALRGGVLHDVHRYFVLLAEALQFSLQLQFQVLHQPDPFSQLNCSNETATADDYQQVLHFQLLIFHWLQAHYSFQKRHHQA